MYPDTSPVTAPDTTAVAPLVPGPAATAAQELASHTWQTAATPEGMDAVQAQAWIAALPEELVDALGYTPVVVDGIPADPHGDCSSPVPLPTSFIPACLTHDLGYGLMRVADGVGERIPAGVRPALDRQLATRMRESCDDGAPTSRTVCRAMSGVADVAVTANSWRQGDGAPVAEKWPWS